MRVFANATVSFPYSELIRGRPWKGSQMSREKGSKTWLLRPPKKLGMIDICEACTRADCYQLLIVVLMLECCITRRDCEVFIGTSWGCSVWHQRALVSSRNFQSNKKVYLKNNGEELSRKSHSIAFDMQKPGFHENILVSTPYQCPKKRKLELVRNQTEILSI